jgi:hypothetical protein
MKRQFLLLSLMLIAGCGPKLEYGTAQQASLSVDNLQDQIPFVVRSTLIVVGPASSAAPSQNSQQSGNQGGSPGKGAGPGSPGGSGGPSGSTATPTGPSFVTSTYQGSDNCHPQGSGANTANQGTLTASITTTAPDGGQTTLQASSTPTPTPKTSKGATTATLATPTACLTNTSATATPSVETEEPGVYESEGPPGAYRQLTASDLEDIWPMYDLANDYYPISDWGTSADLSINYLDNSYLLGSVGMNYENNRGAILTSAAGAAAAGFAIGGPAVAAIAAVSVAAAGIAAPPGAPPAPAPGQPIPRTYFLCDENDDSVISMPGPTSLMLPISLTVTDLVDTIARERVIRPGKFLSPHYHVLVDCWDPLPNNLGWYYKFWFTGFYDIIGTVSPDQYFQADHKITRRSIPYSTCRRGILAVGWGPDVVSTAQKKLPPAPDKDHRIAYYPITIADPRYLRAMPIPTQGLVTMGTVCGANLQTTAGPGTSDTTAASELFAVGQAIKTGQTSSSSSSKNPSSSGGSGQPSSNPSSGQ